MFRDARVLALLVGLTPCTGCARDLARASSGAIGCPHREIAVGEVSVGWSQTSWTARCRGQTFYCSGETAATCSPALEGSNAPEPTQPRERPSQPPARPDPKPPAVDPTPAEAPTETDDAPATRDDAPAAPETTTDEAQ